MSSVRNVGEEIAKNNNFYQFVIIAVVVREKVTRRNKFHVLFHIWLAFSTC